MRTTLVLGLLVLLLLATLGLPNRGAVDISANIEGPDGVAPQTAATYKVLVQGAQGLVNASYRVEYWVEARDTTGARPLKATPLSTTSFGNVITINVTAPKAEGTMDVAVKVTVSSRGGNFTTTATKTVVVALPWTLQVPIQNESPVEARGVLVSFYLDGRPIGNTSVGIIPARTASGPGRANATLTWIPVNVAPGAHELKVTVDLDGNYKIEPELGDYVVTQTIYRSSGQVPAGYVALATVLTAAAFVASIFLIRRRKMKR